MGEPGRVDDLPELDGELSFAPATRSAASGDFGHLVSRTPWAVLRPACARDVAAMTRWAGDHGRSIAARGRGHSVHGRPLVEDGVVVDLTTLDAVREVAADHVVVDAGATWRSVLAATLPLGLTPPVLTNYLDLSVGGTLAVGGIGIGTHAFGMQTDTVRELEVVTGDGQVLTCSPRQNPELYDTVRAGLGQVAIITRATLALVPAPRHVRTYALTYDCLAALAADQRLVLADGRADHVQGAVRLAPDGDRIHLLELAAFDEHAADDRILAGLSDERPLARIADLPYSGYVAAFDALEGLLRSTGEWAAPHPWLLTFVPDSAAEQVARAVVDDLEPGELGAHGQVSFYPFATEAIRTPLVRMPAEPLVFVCNLLRFAPDGADLAHLGRRNRAVLDRVHAAGGLIYPVSALDLTGEEWRRHFGPAWQRLEAARRAYDPTGCLTPGYGVFRNEPGTRR